MCRLITAIFAAWLFMHLQLSGDVHPNPGPAIVHSSSDSSISSGTESTTSAFDFSNHLSVIHYNVQSIKPKLDIIYSELHGFDILTFSETWLSSTTSSTDLYFPSFHPPERKDRPGDSHGGVIVYVKETIFYKRRMDLELNGVECIWIELTLKHKKVLLGTFYRPPNVSAVYNNVIEDSVSLACNSGIKDIIITGDFNFNCFNALSARNIDSMCEQFGLSQTITEPTHFTENSHSLIDLLLVSDKNSLLKSGVAEPFFDQNVRYHCPIYGFFKFVKPKSLTYTRKIWKYDQGDYELLKQSITDTNWNALNNGNTDNYATDFTNMLMEIISKCIPNKTVRIKPREPPWMNNEIKKCIRMRKRTYKKAKRTDNQYYWTKFRTIRNKTISLIRKCKQNYYDNLATKLKTSNISPRDWWKVLKSFLSTVDKPSIPALNDHGQLVFNNDEKAQILNDFFASQSNLNEANKEPPELPIHNPDSILSPTQITPDQVKDILKSLPHGKAPGPDQINNCILSQTSDEISKPLSDLFNACLSCAKFPIIWKEAHVTAIFKKGDPSLANNYRPISLLSVIGKVFERLLFQQIFNFLKETNFLSPFQSGFVPGDSTINQLTYIYNAFCQAIDSGKEVRVIFFDISKAFDRVWHKGIISKLRAAGLSAEFLKLFSDYLDNRRQCVVLPGSKSNWNYIKAGVPQGSILGPLLFLIYINDIVSNISSNIRLFADDTSLYLTINHRNEALTSTDLLNTDISKISKWASDWLVTFNPNKSESMLISKKRNPQIFPPLSMDGQPITDVSDHKHLGLLLSNDCSWHTHIDYIKSKAWPKINIMRKLMYQLDRKSLETIYLSFVQPLLEYGDVIWDNCTIYEKDELNKIQNEAARICSGTTRLVSLTNLAKEIGWDSLDNRRKKHKLIMFYKMINNISPPYLSDLVPQTVSATSRYQLRNTQDLQVPYCRTNTYYNSFLPTAIREWNVLPPELKNANSLETFKRLLNMDKLRTPAHFYTGDRKSQVLHTRLRTKCSALNADLFSKGIVESALCQCGMIEDTYHFFFKCPLYQHLRYELVNTVSALCELNLNILLFGDNSLSLETNTHIFKTVQTFIVRSKRFTQ